MIFFLKFLTKKSRCVLWAVGTYGLGNMVHCLSSFRERERARARTQLHIHAHTDTHGHMDTETEDQ